MDNIIKWLQINKLKLNKNKTILTAINMQSNRSFGINNIVIENVNRTIHLGFIID